MANLLWLIVIVLFIFWVFGFALNLGGSTIHLILVVIAILVIYNLMTGRRTL